MFPICPPHTSDEQYTLALAKGPRKGRTPWSGSGGVCQPSCSMHVLQGDRLAPAHHVKPQNHRCCAAACTRHPGTETTCTYHYLPSDMSLATVAPSTAARAVFSVNSSSQPRCGGRPPLRQRRIHWKQQETAALPAWLHSRLVASVMHTSNVRYAQPLGQQLA
jgi:hypothetical protein